MNWNRIFTLKQSLRSKAVSALYFCATKIEAFRGRGAGDYRSSPDIEDLIAVVDGRAELVNELRSAPDDVRSYIAGAISQMLRTREFTDSLPGHLSHDAASQSRISILLERLADISTVG